MARTIQRLNTLSIKRLLETPTPVLRRTADGDGLYLQTDTDGYSSWIFMWKAGSRAQARHGPGLGPHRDFGERQEVGKESQDARQRWR